MITWGVVVLVVASVVHMLLDKDTTAIWLLVLAVLAVEVDR